MTVQFIGPSGSPASGVIMQNLNLNIGNTSGNCFIGFFNTGGPQTVPYAILTNTYNSKTFMTNSNGQNLGASPYGVLGSGQLTNCKFIDASTAQINSNPSVLVSAVPEASGTILIRFTPTGTFQTQNAVVRAVNLNASSGITDETGLVSSIEIKGFEAGHDSSWTAIGGSTLDNRLFLEDQTASAGPHDYHIALSCSPTAAGERDNFGFLCVIEFL